jgi:hypothetical protein
MAQSMTMTDVVKWFGLPSEDDEKRVAAALEGEADSAVTRVLGERCEWLVLIPLSKVPDYSPRVPAIVRVDYGGSVAAAASRFGNFNDRGEFGLMTTQLAKWFREHSGGFGMVDEARRPSWVPMSSAMSYGGDLGERQGRVTPALDPPGAFLSWYDLNDVPLGGSVWRFNRATLWIFRRAISDGGPWRGRCLSSVKWASSKGWHDDTYFQLRRAGLL